MNPLEIFIVMYGTSPLVCLWTYLYGPDLRGMVN